MKTNLTVLLATATLLACLLTSCTFITDKSEGLKPSKKSITRDYEIKNFTAIDANTVSNIHYTQATDGKCSLQISGPDNFVNLIQVSVKGNTLMLTMDKQQKIRNTKNLKIIVSSPNLDRINFKGVGDINIENKLITNTLDIESKGVGNINIQDLSCQNLTVSSMGVGNVNLKGKAENANLYSKGVGDVEATDLEAIHVKASSHGVGNISCNAVESLDAAVRGVGSIHYKGSPAQKTFSKKGVGSIKSIE
ncbi:head GIN domain-containing protein [Bacteroides sp.]|uniref:head GIN domain-containing protein n=1 Tax=Bacteroides sp. TaxID=29523 RepID=UPI0025BE7756|nr:head GIN domain-containing protein [Bacteroides sp.]